jgi:hypothetical protein
MSFEEKGAWLYALIATVVPTIYFVLIGGQLSGTDLADIDYQPLLLAAIGASIVLTIAGMIGIGIASPNEAGKADQRDKEINRLGEYVGGTVLAAGMIVPFGMAMTEVSHFWIANAMFLVFVVASLIGTITKIALYRRGF